MRQVAWLPRYGYPWLYLLSVVAMPAAVVLGAAGLGPVAGPLVAPAGTLPSQMAVDASRDQGRRAPGLWTFRARVWLQCGGGTPSAVRALRAGPAPVRGRHLRGAGSRWPQGVTQRPGRETLHLCRPGRCRGASRSRSTTRCCWRSGCTTPSGWTSALPPPLAAMVPDRRDVLPELRRAVTRQWPAWWRAAVEEAVLPPDGLLKAWQRWTDDPARSADGPDLRAAVSGLLPECVHATDELRRPLQLPGGRPAFAWEVVREVAEDVAFDHGLDPGRVSGTALVLPVVGPWWMPAAPGVVLCSPAAAQHPVTGRAVLRAAFTTALTGT